MNLFNIRISLGLSTKEAGQLVHVTSRTWELWESGQRKMPYAKQELFTQKIENCIDRTDDELIVVVRDGLPIDVISSNNFLSLDQETHDKWIIKSLAVDRQTQRPYVHSTRFISQDNEHIFKFVSKWKSQLEDD